MANIKLKENKADFYLIRLYDEFIWENYEAQVDEIMKSSELLSVTWDLSNLSYVPWKYIGSQICLMLRHRPVIAEHIKKNTIILPNRKWLLAIQYIFSIVPPISPTELRINDV
jgi:hypothetical protein